MEPPKRPFKVFISYARADRKYLEELKKHLTNLERQGWIESWSDASIISGLSWKPLLLEKLNNADIVLMLISADFVASRFIEQVEVKAAFERYQAGAMTLVPILVRNVDLEDNPLTAFQYLPRNGRPIYKWKHEDEGWTAVVQGLRGLLEVLEAERQGLEQGGDGAVPTPAKEAVSPPDPLAIPEWLKAMPAVPEGRPDRPGRSTWALVGLSAVAALLLLWKVVVPALMPSPDERASPNGPPNTPAALWVPDEVAPPLELSGTATPPLPRVQDQGRSSPGDGLDGKPYVVMRMKQQIDAVDPLPVVQVMLSRPDNRTPGHREVRREVAALLRRIIPHEPLAVLIDVAFEASNDAGGKPELEAALADVHKAGPGIPIVALRPARHQADRLIPVCHGATRAGCFDALVSGRFGEQLDGDLARKAGAWHLVNPCPDGHPWLALVLARLLEARAGASDPDVHRSDGEGAPSAIERAQESDCSPFLLEIQRPPGLTQRYLRVTAASLLDKGPDTGNGGRTAGAAPGRDEDAARFATAPSTRTRAESTRDLVRGNVVMIADVGDESDRHRVHLGPAQHIETLTGPDLVIAAAWTLRALETAPADQVEEILPAPEPREPETVTGR